MNLSFRPIDRIRAWLYAMPLPAFAAVSFVLFAVVLLVLYSIHNRVDPRLDLSFQGVAVLSVVVAAIALIPISLGERSRREKFFGASDRAAYHRVVETESIPDEGVPAHWREQLLTEVDERSRAYLGIGAFVLVLAFNIAAMATSTSGVSPGLIAYGITFYLVIAAALVIQIRRGKKAERMYSATADRVQEMAI